MSGNVLVMLMLFVSRPENMFVYVVDLQLSWFRSRFQFIWGSKNKDAACSHLALQWPGRNGKKDRPPTKEEQHVLTNNIERINALNLEATPGAPERIHDSGPLKPPG